LKGIFLILSSGISNTTIVVKKTFQQDGVNEILYRGLTFKECWKSLETFKKVEQMGSLYFILQKSRIKN